MQISDETIEPAVKLRSEISASPTLSRRLKLKTLLSLFGYAKRSDLNTSHITKILSEKGLTLNPPIVRFGDEWGSLMDDWVHVSDSSRMPLPPKQSKVALRAIQVESDKWFDRLASMILRTEKEVEIKFIVPLLKRLGYDDDDRFDGMPVPAAHGSRDTTLIIDFALFDSSKEILRHQPLLTVEAKKENRLKKKEELFRAHNQAKSYCLWTQCDYFMVTDSQHIQAFHIARGKLNQLDPIFACERHQLKERFPDLYALLSRDVLSKHYLAKFGVSEEIK